MDTEERFQNLVNQFGLNKSGANPFDAQQLDDNYSGASHGEKVTIAFLLNVWNPGHKWKSGKFDVMDALGVWDGSQQKAFCDWAGNPWWP